MAVVERETNMLGNGVYSLAEGARLLRIPAGRLRTWFAGRTNRQQPFLEPDYEKRGAEIALSFRDLVDAFFADHLQAAGKGLRLQSIRRIYDNLKKRYGSKHGFCHQDLRTDGRTVFLHESDADGREVLIDMLDRQHVMAKVFLPFLKKLDFDPESGLANRWRIADGVVVDPAINFGKPIVVGSCVSTFVLAQACKGSRGDVRAVASWWDVPVEEVEAAVRFEAQMASTRKSAA